MKNSKKTEIEIYYCSYTDTLRIVNKIRPRDKQCISTGNNNWSDSFLYNYQNPLDFLTFPTVKIGEL